MTRLVTTRTPVRITFVGGGTDIPEYFRQKPEGGACISATIDKYIHITISQSFNPEQIRVSYSRIEDHVTNVEDIRNPLVRESLKRLGIARGIEISSVTEIPARGTGVGSSSAFLVGLLNALHHWKGDGDLGPESLAKEAVDIERNVLREAGGLQDQYAAAFGGLNYMTFKSSNGASQVKVEPLLENMDAERRQRLIDQLNDHLFLCHLGERSSQEVSVQQAMKVNSNVEGYDRMRKLADVFRTELEAGRISELGRLLHENWLIKKGLSDNISNPGIDRLYGIALGNGAAGGKILGAGAGGMMLFFVTPNERRRLKDAMLKEGVKEVPFRFDSRGTRVLHKD